QYIEVVPNEKYFGGRPYLDRVIFKIVPDHTNLLLQLQTGEVDMMIGVPPGEVSRVQKANSNIKMYPVSGRLYYYIGYNLANPLFASAQVRQALTMAIDRQGIIKALLYGYGKPCFGPLPPMISWVYNTEVNEIPFNPTAAKNLLNKQGWVDHDGDGWLDKDGQKFEFTLKTNAGNQLRSDVAVIVQDQLKKVGIKVLIQTIEWSTLVEALRAKNFEACMGGWSTSFNVDPTPIFHSASVDLFNFGSYVNPRVDALIEKGREEMDRKKSAKIWKEMQKLIYQDQPYTFLFWMDKIVAVNNRFKNVTPIPLSALYGLEKWYQSSDLIN
ncbi:MAG: ABC transporter substrate-binding protein, partial [bacterium]